MSRSNDDDDLPPDLEDVPVELLAANKKETKAFIGDFAQEKSEAPPEKPVEEHKLETKTTKAEPKKESASFGFKKGFLDSGGSKADSKPKEKKKEEPIEIKPTKDKDDWKRFPEVQDSLKKNIVEQKDKWMTPELMEALAKNPNLLKLFSNPEYMQAIQMMQTNPKEVMERYKNNAEFTQLMVEFSQVMGSHFTKLGQQEKKEEQPKKEETIAPPVDKEVDEILKDPKVKSLLNYLQKNEKVDFHRVMQSDPSLSMKIQILISKGYIKLTQ